MLSYQFIKDNIKRFNRNVKKYMTEMEMHQIYICVA